MEMAKIEKELDDRLKAGEIYMNGLDRDHMYEIDFLLAGLDIIMLDEEVEASLSSMSSGDDLSEEMEKKFYRHYMIISFIFHVLEVLRMNEELGSVPPFGLFDLARITVIR